jgi:putative ABC transport system ATP-binding protein
MSNWHASMADASPAPLLRVEGVSKRFGTTPVLTQVRLQLAAGECVALLGESGVGKSTLLNCIAGLEAPDEGHIWIGSEDITRLDEDGRAYLRRARLGFVFQAFHVLPHLSVAENVALPLRLLGRHDAVQVEQLLHDVGLQGLGQRLPAQLSGGQLQRVAIARAVVHDPALILADEPTGNLDPRTAERVLDVLLDRARSRGAACLLVTHSQAAAARADRVLHLGVQGVD